MTAKDEPEPSFEATPLLKVLEAICAGMRSSDFKASSQGEDLTKEQLFQLRLNEYNNLKAEQRERLGAANKLISYHAVALAAAVTAVVALAQHGTVVVQTVPTLLLWMPVLSAPFAYAQFNEELMVRRMGAYIGMLKQQISTANDNRYWQWDAAHSTSPSWVLWISGFFRGGITLLLAAVGMAVGTTLGWPLTRLQTLLLIADLLLLGVGAVITVAMWRVRLE